MIITKAAGRIFSSLSVESDYYSAQKWHSPGKKVRLPLTVFPPPKSRSLPKSFLHTQIGKRTRRTAAISKLFTRDRSSNCARHNDRLHSGRDSEPAHKR